MLGENRGDRRFGVWRARAGVGRRLWLGRDLAVLLAGLVAGCGADPANDESQPFELDVPVERSLLDNGLEVVVVPNHTAPVVTALIAIRAGSAVEDETTNGYSHLFEHMIFQGSEAVPDGLEFRDRLEELGVSSNGTTGVDRVTYFFTAQRPALAPALELFSGAIIAPALDPLTLEKEKQVVLGEFDLNESDSDYDQYHETLAELYGAYTTQLEPLGQRAAVGAATVDQLRALHATYYVPNNSLLVLSGDIDGAQGRALAERYLGSWQRAAEPQPLAPLPEPAPLAEHAYAVMAAPVNLSSIELWWQGPGIDADPEAAFAGELLSAVTFQTDHSFRALVGSDLAYSAALSQRVLRRTSYIRLSLGIRAGDEWRALGALRSALSRLGTRGDVSDAQIESAKQEAFRSYLLSSAEPASLAYSIAEEWALTDSQRFFSLVDRLYAVDAADLTRFVDTYMRNKPRVMVSMASQAQLDAANMTPDTLSRSLE